MSSYLALLTPPHFHGMKGPRLHTFQSRVSIVGTRLSQGEGGEFGRGVAQAGRRSWHRLGTGQSVQQACRAIRAA